jgi:hypothetical protein
MSSTDYPGHEASAETSASVPPAASDAAVTTGAPLMPDLGAEPVAATPTAPEPEASSGVVGIASSAPAPQSRGKTKGVADIVFVVDISGSMAPCIDALRQNIEAFVESLSREDANNASPVKDWRAKVVGYRDFDSADSEGLPWIVDNSFVRDTSELKAQLAALEANGGGDEPESLLDTLYKVATMEATL